MSDTSATNRTATKEARRGYNRTLRAEALRDRLKGAEYLRQIETAAQEISGIQADMRDNPQRYTGAANIRVVRTRVQVIEAGVNINFRRLAKILPDLKSVELSDPDGENPFNGLAESLRAVVTATAVVVDDD